MTKMCFSASMVFIVSEGTLTKVETGNIISVFYIVYAALQVVGGLAVDKYPPERFITIGMVGAAISNFLVYFNQNYVFMMVIWALNGIVQFGVYPAVFKILTTMLKEDQRDMGLVLSGFSNPAGTLASYVVAAFVPHWRYNFLVSAIGLLVFAFVWEVVFAVSKHDLVVVVTEEKRTERQAGEEPFWRLVLRSGVWLFLIIGLVRASFDNGFRSLTPTMIKECYAAVTPAFATILSTVVLVAGALGTISAHFLHVHVFKNEAKALLALLCCALPMVSVSLLAGRVHYVVLVIALALFVWITGMAGFFSSSLISARFGKWGKGGTIAGIFNALAALGVAVANSIFTGIVEATDWFTLAVVWVCMLLAIIALAAILIKVWTNFVKKEF
jgi:OPA family glycerol-3-phosphate transporter-like MFS transporter